MRFIFLNMISISLLLIAGCTNHKPENNTKKQVPDPATSAVTDSTPRGYKSIHQEQMEAFKDSTDKIHWPCIFESFLDDDIFCNFGCPNRIIFPNKVKTVLYCTTYILSGG